MLETDGHQASKEKTRPNVNNDETVKMLLRQLKTYQRCAAAFQLLHARQQQLDPTQCSQVAEGSPVRGCMMGFDELCRSAQRIVAKTNAQVKTLREMVTTLTEASNAQEQAEQDCDQQSA
jgi:hypothetical protein